MDDGHLTVRQLVAIVYDSIPELDVAKPEDGHLDHFSDCEACSDRGFTVGEALLEALTHERVVVSIRPISRSEQVECCRHVIERFERVP